MRIKIFKIGYFFLTTFLLLLFQSCSEEESMIDAEREHKVQELLSVSKALAKKHEIGLCFTERMIRGGIDTLTVEDLEQAYEVYAANTVEFYVCTDSVMANENGLKLSRSSRMARETVLLPGEGNTVYATYNLYWNTFNSTNGIYDATLRIRVDWNSTGVSGVISLYPNNLYLHEQIFQIYNFRNIVIERDNYGYLYFTAETEFQVHYGNIYAYFTLWVEQDNIGQRVRLTLTNYQCTSNSSGSLTLSYDDQIITT